MADIQKVRFNEQSLRRPEEQEKRENQPVETDGAGPVKRLDGEVVRLGEVAFAAGTYCEVWVGRRENSETESGVEKVSLSLTIPIQLMWLFVGGIEDPSSTQVTSIREGA